MILHSINSGSVGNSYAIEINNKFLLLDCGVPYKQIAQALDFKMASIVGCLLTHEHGDHAAAAKELQRRGLNVYTSKGTNNALGGNFKIVERGKEYNIGEFKVKPFDVPHDAAEPFGFLIQHPRIGLLVFITDAMYCKYTFPGLRHALIEANHSLELIEDDPDFLRKRIRKSHMSIDTCCDFIKANSESLETITLLHLSDRNSDQMEFIKRIKQISGVRTYVAEQNNKITLEI